MSLALYKKKRNFRRTKEPQGKKESSLPKLCFVVQRHKASHLHYDFRLEMEGVLKSWAIPKGPSLNPGDKRLAMMVEDHPFDYKDFAGIIPEGNYGAGIVEIWDKGYYTDIDGSDRNTSEKNLLEELKKGSLKFVLHGRKLHGEFALVKMKSRGENAWLLIKHHDRYSIEEPYSSEEQTSPGSPINKALKKENKPVLAKETEKKTTNQVPEKIVLPGRKLGKFISPMLARETDKPFDDKDWVFEIKWDGYRAIAEMSKNKVSLYSRNGNSFNEMYPIVVQELAKMKLEAVIDGEIVVLDEKGKPNFQLLQYYQSNSNHPIVYYVFDILSLRGNDLTDRPLLERKEWLKKIIKKSEIVKYCDHVEEQGIAFFEETKKLSLEGMMAKRKDSIYTPGKRTPNWLKIKHHKTIDAVIAGFTSPRGSRKNFGALLLGSWDGDRLKYIGHTGSGFNEKLLREISGMLEPLIQSESPFNEKIKTNMPATWVKPELACEVKYTEITGDGILRHPIFLRMRTDKPTKEVTNDYEKELVEKTKEKDTSNKIYSFGRIKVPTTHNSKVFWPQEKITKGDVIEYYQGIADYIMPYLVGRPQSLRRNPNGIRDDGFFQKDIGATVPDWIDTFKIFSESNNKNIDYMLCNTKAALAYMNNLGCIEINPMHSTVKAIDKPDYMVIDIDPSEKNTFDQVIEAAQVIHEVLEKAGAANYCKTSGATGLHVYVPMGKKYTYEQVKDFAKIICIMAQQQLPDFTTLERNLKKRGKPNIYLDHLQNRRGQTIAAVYSLRPYPGATVSTPLEWKEVKKGLDRMQFNINTIGKRLKQKGDMFAPVLGKGVDLNKCLQKLEK